MGKVGTAIEVAGMEETAIWLNGGDRWDCGRFRKVAKGSVWLRRRCGLSGRLKGTSIGLKLLLVKRRAKEAALDYDLPGL